MVDMVTVTSSLFIPKGLMWLQLAVYTHLPNLYNVSPGSESQQILYSYVGHMVLVDYSFNPQF